jgi:hypothetical protein
MMDWLDSLFDKLRARPCCGYHAGDRPSTEPTALTALALGARGEHEASGQAADWLADCQADDGSIGIRRDVATPRWPTGLAMLAWLAADRERFAKPIEQAVGWILLMKGEQIPQNPNVGHDTLLVAWPWVEGTHSWIEPTSLHMLALKATGQHDHPRCREAARLLLDRQLPGGGCNYGNTEVLGQTLLPHVQPTGLALLALAGEQDECGRISRSVAYLKDSISAQTTTASLCWGLLGLAAHDQRPRDADVWLEAAFERTRRRDAAPHKFALLGLAALGLPTALQGRQVKA